MGGVEIFAPPDIAVEPRRDEPDPAAPRYEAVGRTWAVVGWARRRILE